jgi:hypothetical protein
MLRAQLDPNSVVLREIDTFNRRHVTDFRRTCGVPLRATVARVKSTGRVESFLAILLSAFSMSPA